jgi:hypothetical protein
MSVDIKLNLIKPSKDLRLACNAYDVISCSCANAERLGFRTLIDLLRHTNKNLKIAIDYSRKYSSLIDKIVLKKKLDKEDIKVLKVLDKLFPININKDYEKIFNNYFLEYIDKIHLKVINIFFDIFTDTKAQINVFSISNTRNGWGGSATVNSYFLSIHNDVDILKIDKSKIFSIIIHEMIHTVNSNNDIFKRINIYLKDNNLPIHSNSFSETFTKTIENICMYKLGYNKEKYPKYRFNSSNERFLEDKIRKVYDSWEKVRGKNKDKFIVYLEKNIDKVFLID